jgi:hypothetical protein
MENEYTLTREQAAAALTDAGYIITRSTLESYASRLKGPPYRFFGKRAMYRLADLLAWAESRVVVPTHKGDNKTVGAQSKSEPTSPSGAVNDVRSASK